GSLRRVPVVHVVRRVLEVPFLRAGIRIESDQAVRIEIVALAHIAVPVGSRIPRTPVDGVALRIVSARHPGGGGPGFPALAFPGFVPRLALGGDGVEAPQPLAGLGVIAIDKSASAKLAARHSGDDLVLYGQRRARAG